MANAGTKHKPHISPAPCSLCCTDAAACHGCHVRLGSLAWGHGSHAAGWGSPQLTSEWSIIQGLAAKQQGCNTWQHPAEQQGCCSHYVQKWQCTPYWPGGSSTGSGWAPASGLSCGRRSSLNRYAARWGKAFGSMVAWNSQALGLTKPRNW